MFVKSGILLNINGKYANNNVVIKNTNIKKLSKPSFIPMLLNFITATASPIILVKANKIK